MDTRSVSCQESCRDDGKAAFSDIILCEQFGDINACNSDMKKHECAEGEYIEVSGGDKRACKKCTAACAPGWGVVSPCQKWADLKCEQCKIDSTLIRPICNALLATRIRFTTKGCKNASDCTETF